MPSGASWCFLQIFTSILTLITRVFRCIPGSSAFLTFLLAQKLVGDFCRDPGDHSDRGCGFGSGHETCTWNIVKQKLHSHVSYVSHSCSLWTETRIILKVSSLRKSGGQTWTCLLGQGKTTDCCYIFSVGKIGQAFRGPGRSLATSRPSQIRKAYEYWVHRSNHVALCYNML